MKEYILCSAIHFRDDVFHEHQPVNIKSGYVVCGQRHHNCYMTVSILSGGAIMQEKDDIQGFLTNINRFVDRKHALQIANDANQLNEAKLHNARIGLFSEDLW